MGGKVPIPERDASCICGRSFRSEGKFIQRGHKAMPYMTHCMVPDILHGKKPELYPI